MRVLFTALIISFCTPALADDNNDSKCDESWGVTRYESCLRAEDSYIADKQLNDIYRQILKRYPSKEFPKERAALISAQRAWIQYRDKVCAFEDLVGGGNYSVSQLRCISRITETRLNELKEQSTW